MKKIIAILFVLAFIGCQGKKEKAFDAFDFAFGGTFSQDFSMKFTQSDTIFVKYHWIRSSSIGKQDISLQNVKTKVIYYGLLQKEARQALLDSIAKIDFKKFDEKYIQNSLYDGDSHEFVFQKDSIQKKITIYGNKAPKELYKLSNLIYKIKQKTKLLPTNKQVDFKADVSPPPPPRP